MFYRPGKIKNHYCEEVSESVTVSRNFFFFNVIVKKLKLYKIYKKKIHILTKNTHTYTQIHKVLQFPFTKFLIMKSLHYNLINNYGSYIFLKILAE